MVVTNNLNVAQILMANPDCEIVVMGGVLRRADAGLTGAVTTEIIERFKLDVAVIGCSALDVSGDLLNFDFQEVHVTQAAIRHARRSCLVADQSKLQRSAPMRVASLRDIDALFTDHALPDALSRSAQDWGTDIRICAETSTN